MYLSRLILNPFNHQVQRDIADPHRMHKSIMRAFPDQLPERERVLFRLETHPRTGALSLLVQSLTQPNWSWLPLPQESKYLVDFDEPNPKVLNFNPHFKMGQILHFRLQANPTIKRKFEGEQKSKRVGLYREEDQIKWLGRKAEQGGFRLSSVQISNQNRIHGRLKRDDVIYKLQFFAVRFDGLLQVTDPDRFLATMQKGVGSGKGLGFGLLSVAPA